MKCSARAREWFATFFEKQRHCLYLIAIDTTPSADYGWPMMLSVTLPPPLADFLRRAAAHPFPSAAEAARAVLRLQRDRDNEAQGEWLRQAIRQGLESGPATPLNLAQIKRLGRARRAAL
jgi:antitoxin ParD1/3/4